MKASRVVLRVVRLREEPLTYYVLRNSLGNEIWLITTLNNLKCEHFTLFVCPLQFLVISAMRRLGNVQSLKHTCFAFELFAMNSQAGHPTLRRLHGKLSPRLTGLPYPADRATLLGGSPHLSYKRDQDKIRNFMDRRVTSPSWGPPPPCKQALSSLPWS